MCLCVLSCSDVSYSLWPRGLYPTSLLCPWDFSERSTGVGCHFPLQGTFPTQGQTCVSFIGRWILYHWAAWEAPIYYYVYILHFLHSFIPHWALNTVSTSWLLGIMPQWKGKHISFWVNVFKVELLDHTVVLFSIFWGTAMLFPIVPVPICIPSSSAQGFPFLRILTNTCDFAFCCCFFLFWLRFQ